MKPEEHLDRALEEIEAAIGCPEVDEHAAIRMRCIRYQVKMYRDRWQKHRHAVGRRRSV